MPMTAPGISPLITPKRMTATVKTLTHDEDGDGDLAKRGIDEEGREDRQRRLG